MARCGCSGAVCNCVVTAGANITVTGAGTPANPYVVSGVPTPFTVVDTTTVDHTLMGTGTTGDPYVLSSTVKVDPAAGNLITVAAGGLRVDCAAISACGPFAALMVMDTPTVDMTLTGTGTVADPWILSAVATGGGGTPVTTANTNSVALSPGTSPLTADVILDPALTNLTTIGPAGVLTQLTKGCGLSGIGTVASPLFVNVGGSTWGFPCPETNGTPIYCAADGHLHGPPEKFCVDEYIEANTIVASTNILTLGTPGGGVQLFGPTTSLTVTNPSPCLPMTLRVTVGNAHLNMRSNNAGRSNVLIGNQLTTNGGAGAFGAQVGNFHQQWMKDDDNAESDFIWDVPDLHDAIPFTGPQVLPPGGSVTYSLRSYIQITNDRSPGGVEAVGFPNPVAQNGGPVVTVSGVIHSIKVEGCN